MPRPRQSRNSTGKHTGCAQNDSRTRIPAITHRLPRPSALGSCPDPSCVQNAPNTFGFLARLMNPPPSIAATDRAVAGHVLAIVDRYRGMSARPTVMG